MVVVVLGSPQPEAPLASAHFPVEFLSFLFILHIAPTAFCSQALIMKDSQPPSNHPFEDVRRAVAKRCSLRSSPLPASPVSNRERVQKLQRILQEVLEMVADEEDF